MRFPMMFYQRYSTFFEGLKDNSYSVTSLESHYKIFCALAQR